MTDNNTYILTLELPSDDEPQEIYIGNSEGLRNYLIENSSDLFDWITDEVYSNPYNRDKFANQTLQAYNDYLVELVTLPFRPQKINEYLRFANKWDNFNIELEWFEAKYTTYTYTVMETDPETGKKELSFEGSNEEVWKYLIDDLEPLFDKIRFSDYPNTDEGIKKEYDQLLTGNKYLYQLMSSSHDPTKLQYLPSNITLEWS